MSVSGLYRAPVTKALLVTVPLLTLSSGWLATPLGTGTAPAFSLAGEGMRHLLAQGSFSAWVRLPVSLLACDSLAEALVSCLLLYRLRDFERQMGCVFAMSHRLSKADISHGDSTAIYSASAFLSFSSHHSGVANLPCLHFLAFSGQRRCAA